MFEIKQYVCKDSCLNCLGCCRFSKNPTIWAPNLLREEKSTLKLDRLELVIRNDFYLCSFLNPENNCCRIYAKRPLECVLYPFLFNNSNEGIYLGVHLSCSSVSDKTSEDEFINYFN